MDDNSPDDRQTDNVEKIDNLPAVSTDDNVEMKAEPQQQQTLPNATAEEFPNDSVEFLKTVTQLEIDIKEQKEEWERKLLIKPTTSGTQNRGHKRKASFIPRKLEFTDPDSSVEYLGGGEKEEPKMEPLPLIHHDASTGALSVDENENPITDELSFVRHVRDYLDPDYPPEEDEENQESDDSDASIPCRKDPNKSTTPPIESSSGSDSVFDRLPRLADPIIALNLRLQADITQARILIDDQRELLELQSSHIELLQISARPKTTTSVPVAIPLMVAVAPINEERRFPKHIEPLYESDEEVIEDPREHTPTLQEEEDMEEPQENEIEDPEEDEPVLEEEELEDPNQNMPAPDEREPKDYCQNTPTPDEVEMDDPCDNEPAPEEEEMEELREHTPVPND